MVKHLQVHIVKNETSFLKVYNHTIVDFKSILFFIFQLHTDLVCDIGFNPKYPETLVTVGKEHTCWWKVYPESETIQASAKPEYDVNIYFDNYCYS